MSTRVESALQNVVRIEDAGCSFVFSRVRGGVLLITITGHDKGQARKQRARA
jgi:hypothetical protein